MLVMDYCCACVRGKQRDFLLLFHFPRSSSVRRQCATEETQARYAEPGTERNSTENRRVFADREREDQLEGDHARERWRQTGTRPHTAAVRGCAQRLRHGVPGALRLQRYHGGLPRARAQNRAQEYTQKHREAVSRHSQYI